MIGRVLLHYRILHPLGAGGMGEVYAAEDTRLNRRVALKLLPHDTADDAARLQRFRREAQAIASLNHPNVVTIYAVEECDGVLFLTMEIVEGHTIDALIPAAGVTWRNFFKWAIPLVDAIAAAHQQNVVHRDIKPSNIMVGDSGRVKVLDFGIAKVKPTINQQKLAVMTTESVTGPLQVLGTTAYMSPEQAEGKSVDPRSDIFSLGIVLYEMACGSRPFKGDTALSLLSSIIKDPMPPLLPARPDAPADLDRIIRRCLAKEPERRYQTALDLKNELEDLQQQVLTGAAIATPAPSSRPWLTAAAMAIAIAVLGVAGAVVWRRAPSVSPASTTRATFSQQTSQPGIEWFPSLSPDGRWLVYAGDAAGNRDIYLQSVGGQTPINLTRDSPADEDQPAFSPDGEQIVFRSTREGGGLFVMGRTGESVRRITRAGFNPAWSRDGKQIAYTSFRLELRPQNTEGVSELYVVNAEGGEARRLSEVDAALPSWSPSGGRLAFGSRRGQGAADRRLDIVTIAPDGGALVPVTEDAHIDWNPVWAPDGRHLYFISDRGGSTNIWRIAIDEATGRAQGEAEPITSPAPFAAHLSISADGRRLAYSSVIETQNIFSLGLDPASRKALSPPVPITSGSRFWANPDPSPAGESVVAYSQVNPEGDLYLFQTDGSGAMRQLTSDEAIDRVPRWSPDGAWIATFSDRDGTLEPWLIRPDGSDLHKNSKGPGASIMAWSPDAKRIAFNMSGSLAAAVKGRPNMGIMPADPASPDAAEVLIPGPPTDGRFVPNSWSHDGKWLVGQQWFGVLGVFRFSVQARTFERLTDFGEWPVWLPDNRHVLFVSRGREFHILDTQTKTTTQIFSVLRDTLGPPRLTRDGRRAFFSRRITESDVWMVNLQ